MNKNLFEDSRTQLVSKSKSSEKGSKRYKRRTKSRVASNVQQFNRIDMNQLFKDGIININIEVKGETDAYVVKISFGGFLDSLRQELGNNNIITLRDIIKALIIAFNKEDVYIRCSCPDFKYRFAYWATVNKINSGEPELRPADETNPEDKLGSACKHILLVLSNTAWLVKVSSVINNYIKYMERYRQTQYDSIIYPAIYKKEKPVQLSLIDDEDSVSDNDSTINTMGSKLGRGRKPSNPSVQKVLQRKKEVDPNQQSLFDDEED